MGPVREIASGRGSSMSIVRFAWWTRGAVSLVLRSAARVVTLSDLSMT
jgi:hypothetical protein